ncbi:MAG: DHH family phosphoesterase [Alphaproteobacteria bacterium]|nr:DHH family phosphoesterase [Alphaproteobacteria bacterium]
MQEKLKNFDEKIRSAKTIAIFAHKNLDGDAMCSVLALGRLLELNYGARPVCMYDGNLPDSLANMPLRSRIRFFGNVDASEPFDVAIVLDYGVAKNIGGPLAIAEKAKFVIEIDHHKNDEPIGNLCIDDDTAAATGQILYRMMVAEKWQYDIDVLNLLAVALLTDTGHLKYITNAEPLRIMADLVDNGVKIRPLMEAMNNKDRKNVLTEADVVANTEFFYHHRLALATVPHKSYKYLDGRGEMILSMLGQIRGVDFIVLLKHQKENQIGVSIRSRGKPINHIAAALGGGGHLCAAGAVVADSLENVRAKVLELFRGE